MKIKIESNLRLELVNESHASELFKLTDANRKYLRSWLPWVDFTKTEKDTLNFIKDSRESHRKKRSSQFVIIYEGAIAGMIGIHGIERFIEKKTEIGYWLGENFQGKGIMTKSCGALIDHCFRDLKLDRINIKCHTKNKKSREIPKRLNFFYQGILKRDALLNGVQVDHAQYVMRLSDWENLRKK